MKQALTVLFLFFCHLVCGQNPYYYNIDKTKGLPSNSVYDIFQDKTGYIWLATDEGLSRYNGSTFKNYYSNQQSSRAGSCIGQDKYGRIWYSNFDGYLYYVENNELKTLKNQQPTGYNKFGIIDDYLYLRNKKGVGVYDLKTLKQATQLNISDKLMSFSSAANGKFYVLGSALYEFKDAKLLRKIVLPSDFYTHLKSAVIMQSVPHGVLFVSKFTNANYLFSQNKFMVQNRSMQLDFVQNVSQTGNDLWMCSAKGAYFISSNGVSQSYFENHNISYVFKDNKGNYWFSTLNRGLLLVPNLKNTLLQMQPRPLTLAANKKGVVASTENGDVYQIELSDLSKQLLYANGDNHAVNQLFVDTLNDNILFTSKKFTILNHVYQLQKQVGVAVKDVKPIDDVYCTFAASGYSGIFKRVSSTKKSIWDSLYWEQKRQSGKKDSFRESSFLEGINGKATIYNLKNQTIYYATNEGLFYQTTHKQGEIKDQTIRLFIKKLQVYNGMVYALTTNGNLLVVDDKNMVSPLPLKMDSKQGFINKIKIINNMLYIMASSAVYEYNLISKKITNVMELGADFEVSDLELYHNKFVFATAKGVLLQNKNTHDNKSVSPLVLDEITVNDSLVNTNILPKLTYKQNNIAINYSLLAFTPQQKQAVYYKINQDKWQQLPSFSGSLKLTSLAPGNYTVSFSQTTNGIVDKTVFFTIAKPFWLSAWFIGALLSLFLLLIYVVYRYKIEQNNKRNQRKLDRVSLENNLNQSKLKAIKSQMNPHFFYNALNTIQSYILSNEKKQAVNYLSKFANLTRTILEMSEKEEVTLAEEIRTIGFYLDIEKARFDNDFDYTISEEGIETGEDLRIPSMLLQPYLENAIKHGLLHKEGDKKLEVIFKKEIGRLIITIDDNGIGRKKSMALNEIKELKYKSFATAATQSRIDLLNNNKQNKISIIYLDKIGANQQGVGTTVTIKMPLTKSI